jgi:hypothetical protein
MMNKKAPSKELPPGFMYLVRKARIYLKMGPNAYRAADYYRMPPNDCSEKTFAAIHSGMTQICKYRGWSRDNPLEGLGIEGFNTMLSTLHFELTCLYTTKLDDSTTLDEMHMRHRVTGDSIILYNRVPEPFMGLCDYERREVFGNVLRTLSQGVDPDRCRQCVAVGFGLGIEEVREIESEGIARQWKLS